MFPQERPRCGCGRTRVVALSYLKQLHRELLENEDKKPFAELPPSPLPPSSFFSSSTPHTTPLTLSQYALHDSTHSCAACSASKKALPVATVASAKLFSQTFPMSCDRHVTVRWYIPPSMTKYCVLDVEKRVLERLCLLTEPVERLDTQDENLFHLLPVFTPSVGRDSTALLNLAHSRSDGLHVVVTTGQDMAGYMRAWPGHMIMSFPDNEASGRGQSS